MFGLNKLRCVGATAATACGRRPWLVDAIVVDAKGEAYGVASSLDALLLACELDPTVVPIAPALVAPSVAHDVIGNSFTELLLVVVDRHVIGDW